MEYLNIQNNFAEACELWLGSLLNSLQINYVNQ